jgi:hypothetical protein
MIVKTDLELIENAITSKDVKADSKAFRKPNGSDNLPFGNLDRKVLDINGYETSVTHYNHLPSPLLPIDSETMCLIYVQNGKNSSGIHVDPHSVVKDRNGNYWEKVVFMKCVREFDKRQAISSSRGTRSTDGILCGSISRALASTSVPDSPTATTLSLTTAIYLPAYLLTSSLKCSTSQRSSLSMAFLQTKTLKKPVILCFKKRIRDFPTIVNPLSTGASIAEQRETKKHSEIGDTSHFHMELIPYLVCSVCLVYSVYLVSLVRNEELIQKG